MRQLRVSIVLALSASMGLLGCETVQRMAPGGLFRPGAEDTGPPNPIVEEYIESYRAEVRKEGFPSLADMPSAAPTSEPKAEIDRLRDELANQGASLRRPSPREESWGDTETASAPE